MNASRSKARFIIGGILVALGAVLLLSNTGLITLSWFWDFAHTWWPFLLILWGLWEVVSGGFRFRLWPIILLLLGIGFQLSALNLWEWDFSVVWPVFIVIVGLAILLGRRDRRTRRQERAAGHVVEGRTSTRSASGDIWRAAFNSIEERYEGQEFRGGEVETNFGNVALDLRDTELSGGSALLEVNLTFGGLHMRVPPGWQVDLGKVNNHFGHVQDKRGKPIPEAPTGVLKVEGTVTFGNLEISD